MRLPGLFLPAEKVVKVDRELFRVNQAGKLCESLAIGAFGMAASPLLFHLLCHR